MRVFLVRRIGQFLIVAFGASVVLFVLLSREPFLFLPICGPRIFCKLYPPGLSTPLQDAIYGRARNDFPALQYLNWIRETLRGNLGLSQGGIPVTTMIADALPTTLFLVLLSIVFTQLVSLPLALLLATLRSKWLDGTFNALSHVGLAMPTMALGLTVLFVLTVASHWLPAGRVVFDTGPPFATHEWYVELQQRPRATLSDLFSHAILPVLTLSSVAIAFQTRFARTVLDEVLDSRHARNGRSAGLRGRVLLVRHALRQAAPDIIRGWARGFPALLGAIILTEQIFTYTGLGFMFFNALGDNDFAVLDAVVVLATALVLVVNLIADIACAWLDPKIRRPRRGVWVANIPVMQSMAAMASDMGTGNVVTPAEPGSTM